MAPTKESLHQAVLDQQDELLELCRDLIRIKNQSPIDSQAPAIAFVRDYLAQAGIETEEIVGDGGEDYPVVYAQMGDPTGFRVVLNGHVDVVPVGQLSGWDFDPFGAEMHDGKIFGRGASDMKCGLAVLLFTMKKLKESGAELKGDIRLHMVCDEEIAGSGTKWFCEHGYADGADAVMVGEPTGHETIEIGQKGILHVTLTAHGVPGHGSTNNYKGDNAIVKLARVLVNIDQIISVPGHFLPEHERAVRNSRIVAEQTIPAEGVGNVVDHISCNVGLIEGGSKINQVPDLATAHIDVRLPYGTDHDEVVAAVERVIAESGVTGVEAAYEWITEGNVTSDTCTLVTSLKKNIEDVWGEECLPAYQWASSDAANYRLLGCPTIQFGPCNNDGIHGYNEDVDVIDVVHAAEIYMLTLCDMLGVA
ncbi:M20 family metallopeptidase [Enorma phocaeensis]|uniref:ArgE/DapE family deacylase n=1 Tax=Enorma phocaeensis TaxID=1871019 RepID=A0A921IVC6_9ACTN|nr:ArgE/DapE family deacylase [Enorma phocaeensis]HJG36824.1 ArgE/DapE family deacylase [Enorma phocaeensis]